MGRRGWMAIALLLVLAGLPVALGYQVLHSEWGLQFLVSQLHRIPGVRIEVGGARGVLAGPLEFDRVIVEHPAVRIDARDLRLDLETAALLGGQIELESATIGRVDIVLVKREEKPPSETHFLPRFLTIEAPGLSIRNIGLTLADGQRLEVASLRGDLRLTRWRLDAESLLLEDPAGRVTGRVTLRGTLPLTVNSALAGSWRLPDERSYEFTATTRGRLERLALVLSLSKPARLAFTGTGVDLTGDARLVGTLRLNDFDGAPWLPPGSLPRLSGSIALDARRDAIGLDGTFTADALPNGPLRVQGGGRWQEKRIEIASLRAWLPASGLSAMVGGSVAFDGDAPGLSLKGEWTMLRWPLDGTAAVESPQGRFEIHGSLPYAFTLSARARGPGFPEADLTAAGSVDRERLVLDRLGASVLRGRVDASGQLSWTGAQPWQARVAARQIDVAGIRPDLKGRMDASGSIEGQGFTLASPWSLQLQSLSGTLQGRALAGSGTITHRDGTYDLRRVRLANAGSYVSLDGRYGPRTDLAWDANIRSLAVVSRDLDGGLVSKGRLVGPRASPRVTGDAAFHDLRYGEVSAGSGRLDLDLDLADAVDSRVELVVNGLEAAGLHVAVAAIDARGRLREHLVDLRFTVPGDEARRLTGFKGAIDAAGSLDLATHRWQGTLSDVSLTFPDGSSKLIQPVALEAGPDAVKLAHLCLTTGDARLCAEGEWHREPESWRVLYSAQDWPLRRVLTSLFGRREFDGKLQASGWAERKAGEDWVGATTVLLDDPTVDIRRNQFRTERFELGRGQLTVLADATAVRLSTELRVGAGTSVQGQATVRRAPGLELADQPLDGELRVGSTELSGLALIVPEIDRSAGHLQGSLRLSGRLGDPRFDGEFEMRDASLAMYRTNLTLSDITLDGRFAGDELEFSGNATTRTGPLSVQGRFTWPDGVMTGRMHLKGDRLLVADSPDFRILASPDLTLTAGADGFLVTGEVLIPQARISPRDLTTTVNTSPDERIVGVETEETGPSTLQRIRSRVRMAFGDDVRLDTMGLRAQLGGEVTVSTEPGDVPRGNGAIRLVEGEFRAFGQMVRITRGVLSYKNQPLDDPTLDLVAERDIVAEDIVITVNVRGQLDNPFVTLSSDPPMSNNEALSYLLTGRSINTLQSNEAATVDMAAQSLAMSGGGLLLGSLGTRVGLDEVAVERTGDDDTSVVLGKALSPRLYVSYGISIAESINTIKLRYTLNSRWSLKAEAGLEQSADVEYRIER